MLRIKRFLLTQVTPWLKNLPPEELIEVLLQILPRSVCLSHFLAPSRNKEGKCVCGRVKSIDGEA